MLQKLFFAFVLFLCNFAFGQFKISGQILDEKNNPTRHTVCTLEYVDGARQPNGDAGNECA